MFKKLLAALLAFTAIAAFAAVDVNKATQAELEEIKGIGPAMSTRILTERKKAAFKDWTDMAERVKGVGEGNAKKFSAAGLTVNGAAFQPSDKPAKKEKAAAKQVAKASPVNNATVGTAPAAAKK